MVPLPSTLYAWVWVTCGPHPSLPWPRSQGDAAGVCDGGAGVPVAGLGLSVSRILLQTLGPGGGRGRGR